MDLGNGATVPAVVSEPRTAAKVFRVARPEQTVAKVEDAAKPGESSPSNVPGERNTWLTCWLWTLVSTVPL